MTNGTGHKSSVKKQPAPEQKTHSANKKTEKSKSETKKS